MENKSSKIAAIIGVILGCIIGSIISSSMLKEHKKCEILVEENKMLRDMLYEEQNPQ